MYSGTLSGTFSVTIVWHNLYKKSITSKCFRENCIASWAAFVQIGLRANQNMPIVPQIPGTNQKQPVKPYRFVTFRHRAVVLSKGEENKKQCPADNTACRALHDLEMVYPLFQKYGC